MKMTPEAISRRIIFYGTVHVLACYLVILNPEDYESTKAFPIIYFLVIFGPLGFGIEHYFRIRRNAGKSGIETDSE